jgi:hypothetical protein
MQNARADKKQATVPNLIAGHNNGSANGASMPAVPVLQQKDTGHDDEQQDNQQTELQGSTTQLSSFKPLIQKKANNTGLPDDLKSGIENLSGFAMDDARVHYNSSQPAQLNAHAYAQGTDIHVAPGQEKHLPHEAWHVVQQKQGRVQATKQMKGSVPVNDDKGLEYEADVMGARALASATQYNSPKTEPLQGRFKTPTRAGVAQLHLADDLNNGKYNVAIAGETHDAINTSVEKRKWRAEGVKVVYEEGSVTVNDGKGTKVKPDPPELRLSFAFAAMEERVCPELKLIVGGGNVAGPPGPASAAAKPSGTSAGPVAKPAKGKAIEDAVWTLKYLSSVLANDLSRGPDDDDDGAGGIASILAEINKLNEGTLVEILADPSKSAAVAGLLLDAIGEVGKVMHARHKSSAFRTTEFKSGPLRVSRSQQMLGSINKISGSLAKTIYKVGNDHVLDMRRNALPVNGKVIVLDREQYKADFDTIETRGGAATPKAGAVATPYGPPPGSGAKAPVPAKAATTPYAPDPRFGGIALPGMVPAKAITASSPYMPPSGSRAGVAPLRLPGAQLPASQVKVTPKEALPPSGSAAPPFGPSASGPLSLPARSPIGPPSADAEKAEKPKKKKQAVAPRSAATASAPPAPVKSAADLKVEQLLMIYNAASVTAKDAKGCIEIAKTLDYYNEGRTTSQNIINEVERIIGERNDRFALVKFFARSKETQKLYDDLLAAIG